MLRRREDYEPENEEVYVYDQRCENCVYYCDWGCEEDHGCKYYDRPEYEKYPACDWCCDWTDKRRSGRLK